MLELIIKIVLLVVGVAALLILVFCAMVWYSFKTRQVFRKLGENVSITPEWIEIVPTPPIRVRKRVQSVNIYVDGASLSLECAYQNKIRLPDGSTVLPEVEIVDESGSAYQMRPSGLFSNGLGYKPETSLAHNRRYTRVRIRSDQAFNASDVFWEDMNLK